MPISIHALREEGDTQLTLLEQTTGIISIHALREEGDQSCASGTAYAKNDFYPRPPRGGRLAPRVFKPRAVSISIHALREEGDNLIAVQQFKLLLFLSTPSARRATMEQIRRRINNGISIHALREEGDPQLRQGQLCRKEFLSTPSARRATHSGGRRGLWLSDFYPRPPRGGRPYQAETRFGRVKFLSTPSARRATIISRRPPVCKDISIHALREEGDSKNRDKISIFL